jgi:translation initiation factor 3 subunit H
LADLQKADEAGQARRDNEPAEDLSHPSKPIAQPSRLESLLITNQINNYCQQISQFAGQGFSKLYMVAGLHKDDPSVGK